MADKDIEQQLRDFIASEISDYTEHGLLRIAPPSGESGISPIYARELVEKYLGLNREERASYSSFESFVSEELNINEYITETANIGDSASGTDKRRHQ